MFGFVGAVLLLFVTLIMIGSGKPGGTFSRIGGGGC
jgi:hypothetical protein